MNHGGFDWQLLLTECFFHVFFSLHLANRCYLKQQTGDLSECGTFCLHDIDHCAGQFQPKQEERHPGVPSGAYGCGKLRGLWIRLS